MKLGISISILLAFTGCFAFNLNAKEGIDIDSPERILGMQGEDEKSNALFNTQCNGASVGHQFTRHTCRSAIDWRIANAVILRVHSSDNNFATSGIVRTKLDTYGKPGLGTTLPQANLHIPHGEDTSVTPAVFDTGNCLDGLVMTSCWDQGGLGATQEKSGSEAGPRASDSRLEQLERILAKK